MTEQTPFSSWRATGKSQFETIVGNVGTVYRGNNGLDARFHARTYVDRIKTNNAGRACSPVVVLQNGEIVEEWSDGSESEEI